MSLGASTRHRLPARAGPPCRPAGAVAGAARRLEAAGLSGRCETRAGDLLEAVPRGADAYVLQRVLHGYGDGDARRILRNCRAAIPAGGRLLAIEAVLPDRVKRADPAPEKVLMGDLNMLAVTGGRERSGPEWASLLASAGFELRRIVAVPGTTACILEAAPIQTEIGFAE